MTVCLAPGSKTRFLQGLAPAECDLIVAAASKRRYPARAVVTNQGDPAEYLFMLMKGRARFFFLTEDGRKIPLAWIVPGDPFGAMSLLPRTACYLVSTEMLKDGEVLVWRRQTAQDLSLRYPRLLQNVLSIGADHIEWVIGAQLTVIGKTARQRIRQALAIVTNDIGEKVAGGISLWITNEELAAAANVTPFTASRLLNELQRQGVVVKSRGKLLLRSHKRPFAHAA